MAKRKINVGDEFGSLTVIEDMGVTSSHHHYYKCICSKCKMVSRVRREKLLNTENPACQSCSTGKDYKDKVIGGFKFIRETKKRTKSRNKIWKCKCVRCGRTIEIPTTRISKSMPKCKCETYKGLNKSYIDQIF